MRMLLVFLAFLALVLAICIEETMDARIDALETRMHALEMKQ